MAEKSTGRFLKYFLWAVGIVAGFFILLLAAAAIIVPIVLPPAKLKAMAMEKLSKALKHQVTLGDIHFNVLSGFDVKNLVIANRAGWDAKPMVAAKDISISYHLFPLLWGEVSLGEIRLIKPDIFVEHRNPNQFNFSDMMGSSQVQAAPAPAPPPPKTSKSKSKSRKKPKAKKHKRSAWLQGPSEKPAFHSFFVDSAWAESGSPAGEGKPSAINVAVGSLNILHANLEYLDETTQPAQKSVAPDLNLRIQNISTEGGKTSFTLAAPVNYLKKTYNLDLSGNLRFFMADMSMKGLDLKGAISDQSFKVTGDATFSNGFAPNMDGEASLNILKFWGLIPGNLSSMPEGLSLTGPAQVAFHLGGDTKSGLALSGTADGSQLAVQYKDYFLKTNKNNCKVDFKTLNHLDQGVYEVSSFKVQYDEWEVTGAFHYRQNASYFGEIHSKNLPFKGLPGMIPKLKGCKVDGSGSLDLQFSQVLGKPDSLRVDGLIPVKGIGITLPNKEPYLQDMAGFIYLNGSLLRVPKISFKSFDGTGAAGVTWNFNANSYSYGFSLVNVDAQKAVDGSIDAYVAKKDYSDFKDTLYGTLNMAYSGTGKGFSGDAMLNSQVGKGTYALTQAKLKNLKAVKFVNGLFADKSDELKFQRIDGTMGMKNSVYSYTANCSDKVGTMQVVGGINGDGVYAPDMKIKLDIKKEFLDSDQIQNLLKQKLGAQASAENANKLIEYASDDQGNLPIDFRFTGKASKTPGMDCLDLSRAENNAARHLIKDAAQNGVKSLMNLFGK